MPDMNAKPGKSVALKPNPASDSLNILNYTDYRQFLKDYYQVQKRVDPDFSLRYFAKKAKFPSHGLLKYLMDGKRNLSKKTLVKLSVALDFSKEQSEYFENLVFFNQGATLEDKQFYYNRLLLSSPQSSFKKLEASQLQIFRKWHTIAIREMLNLREFRNSPAWIAGRLLPKIDSREVEESLQLLVASGLIKRTANGYKAVDPDITTNDEVKSFLIKSYHSQMLKMAAWAQDKVSGKERDISSVCFAIKESELPNLKKQIQLMRKELRNFAAEDGEGDRIVQVNLQMFPLTRSS